MSVTETGLEVFSVLLWGIGAVLNVSGPFAIGILSPITISCLQGQEAGGIVGIVLSIVLVHCANKRDKQEGGRTITK